LLSAGHLGSEVEPGVHRVEGGGRSDAGHDDLGGIGQERLAAVRRRLAADGRKRCQHGNTDGPDRSCQRGNERRQTVAAHGRTVAAGHWSNVVKHGSICPSAWSPVRLRSACMAPLKPEQIIALLAPIVVIQLGLMIAALYDLEREERRVRGGSKLVWALVIVFVNVIGPIIYFVAGREEA
jgi:hypothetical protein